MFVGFRSTLRLIRRDPSIPAFVVVLFALGLGLASGMWAVIDAALLRPLPYHEPRSLAFVFETHPERGTMAVTPANFLDLAALSRTLEELAGGAALDASVSTTGLPERVVGAKVTDRFFALWGVAPARGRWLNAADYRPGARVAVIGDALWRRMFGDGSWHDALTLRVDGEPYTVVGVMPASFRDVGGTQLWVPWLFSREERAEARFHLVGAVARVRAGRTVEDVDAELRQLYRRFAEARPEARNWSARAAPFRSFLLEGSMSTLGLLGTAVMLVLLVTCLDIAGLLLAWMPSRRRDVLIRLALGASPGSLVVRFVGETLVLGAVGLLGGAAIARTFVDVFAAVAISPMLPYAFVPVLDARVVAAMGALLLVVVAVTGLGPALVTVYRAPSLAVTRPIGGGWHGDGAVLALQVAGSLVLLALTLALVSGFQRLAGLAPARSDARALAMDVSLPDTRYPTEDRQRLFFDRLLDALEGRAEIRQVGAASYVPPTPPLGNVRFTIEGRVTDSNAQTALASAVTPTAFGLLGLTLRSGRLLDERDRPETSRSAVISATLARRYWGEATPVGQRLTLVGVEEPVTIVGVVSDVRQPLSGDARAEAVLYLHQRQVPWPFLTLVVVPAQEDGPAVRAVREEVARADAGLSVGPVRPLDELREDWLVQPRLRATVVSVFGAVSLLVTLVGLYASVSRAVAVRRKELALRQALGASPGVVVRALVRERFSVVAIGLAAGLALLPAVAAVANRLLGAAARVDTRASAAATLVLAAGALAAAWWAARAASRIAPAEALRREE